MNFIKKLLVVIFVIVIYPFIFVVTWLKKIKLSKNLKHNILVIDDAKIGDIVCASPVFRAIKERYPDFGLIVMINPKTEGIIKNNPHINKIISIKQKFYILFINILRENISMSVSLVPGSINYILPYLLCLPIRSVATAPEYGIYYRILAFICSTHSKIYYPNSLSVKHYLDLLIPLGIRNDNLKKEVFIDDGSKNKVGKIIKSHGFNKDRFIGYSLTAGNKMKEWPGERFIRLAQHIYTRFNLVPIFYGTKSDKDYISSLVNPLKLNNVPFIIATDFKLEELPAAISVVDYFIGVDTGTIYIANALDIPVVDIAGPCNIYDQIPIYEKCEVVYVKGLPGWPYSSVLKTVDELNEEQRKSILGINVDDVIKAFEVLYNKYDKN